MKIAKIIYCFLLISVNCFGQNWYSLKGSINDPARQMYADTIDNYLYVSGRFYSVDGKRMKGIARWNGLEWDSLRGGLDGLDTLNFAPNGLALGMVRYDNNFYICGNFTSLGNLKAKHIGKWNGLSWDSLSIQPNFPHGNPSTLAVFNNELYVGGQFDTVAGIPANSIAKWNGSNWSQLNFPNLFPLPSHNRFSNVASMCYYHGKLYVVGAIKSYPVDTIGQIMSYDGNQWQTVSGGIKGISAGLGSIIVYHDELYVAGVFTTADGNPGNNIQKWNDTTWSDVGGGTGYTNGTIDKLLIFHDELYVLGVLESAGGIPADRIAKWDGIKWCSLGSTFDNVLTTSSVFHDSLFIGGGFWTIDGDSINYIAKWTGGNYVDSCSIPLSIDEFNNTSQVNIYPNPAKNQLQIKSSKTNLDKIKISDILGKEVYFKANTTASCQIDISFLTTGLYFLIIETKEGRVVKKFVKE